LIANTDAAVVRPVIAQLNVRREGPDSDVIGALRKDQWVAVQGACGDWLHVRFGYREGWVFGPLTCQSLGDPEAGRWRAAVYCGDYTDEELAAAGKEALAHPRAKPRLDFDSISPRATDDGPEAITERVGGSTRRGSDAPYPRTDVTFSEGAGALSRNVPIQFSDGSVCIIDDGDEADLRALSAGVTVRVRCHAQSNPDLEVEPAPGSTIVGATPDSPTGTVGSVANVAPDRGTFQR
jgi:hypothetical protein